MPQKTRKQRERAKSKSNHVISKSEYSIKKQEPVTITTGNTKRVQQYDFSYVRKDIKRILLVAGFLILIIVVIYFIMR